LSRYPEARQKQIIVRELLIAFVILLSFAFLGKEILGILGISRGVLEVAGGLILLLIAVGMLFPKPQTVEAVESEPFMPNQKRWLRYRRWQPTTKVSES
jgi:multiple antibiotic resistance protein